MNPLLHGHERGTSDACPLVARNRGLDGFSPARVLGAVLVACEIEAAAVFEGVDCARRLECRCEHLLDRPSAKHDLAAVFASQPAPESCRRRRDFEGLASVVRKRAQPLDFFLQPEEQQRAEPDDARFTVDGPGQSPQGLGRVRAVLETEAEVSRRAWNRLENSLLCGRCAPASRHVS